MIAGLCMGSSQSAGRAIAGLFAPSAQLGEFFGLWTLATRLSAIVGPITYGLVTVLTCGQPPRRDHVDGSLLHSRPGLLAPVNVARGMRAARPDGDAPVTA